jgi:TonB family protein
MDEEAIIMFEHIAERPVRRRSWPALILTMSIAGHAAAAVALLVVAMWQIARLTPPERQIRVVSMASPVPVSVDQPPARRIKPRARPTPSSRPVRELVQSNKTPESTEETEVEVEFGAAEGTGHDHGVPDGRGANPVATSIGDHGAGVPMAPMKVHKPPAAPEPRMIPEHMLKGKRVAGNEQIRPPDSVRLDMVRAGTRRLTASIKMCLDAQGRVESMEVLKSTGHDAYDREFLREMRGWRYQPYRIGGEAAAVCTPINFVYDMRD